MGLATNNTQLVLGGKGTLMHSFPITVQQVVQQPSVCCCDPSVQCREKAVPDSRVAREFSFFQDMIQHEKRRNRQRPNCQSSYSTQFYYSQCCLCFLLVFFNSTCNHSSPPIWTSTIVSWVQRLGFRVLIVSLVPPINPINPKSHHLGPITMVSHYHKLVNLLYWFS